MSRVTPVSAKKRKLEQAMKGKTEKPRKRIRKQKHYHSSSDEEEQDSDTGFAPVSMGDSEEEASKPVKKQKSSKSAKPQVSKSDTKKSKQKVVQEAESSPASDADTGAEDGEAPQKVKAPANKAKTKEANTEEEASNPASDSDSNSDSGSNTSSHSETHSTTRPSKTRSKRNDSSAFATSISKILSTKLPTSSRADPVLSRSADASKARAETLNTKLEAKARSQIRAQNKLAKQKGRTTDVLGIERGITGEVAEKEKQLRKIAQRGVIQLFNAFRAAHGKAEEVRREESRKGTIGIGERERKANEVSKEGFLELIGGKKKTVEAT